MAIKFVGVKSRDLKKMLWNRLNGSGVVRGREKRADARRLVHRLVRQTMSSWVSDWVSRSTVNRSLVIKYPYVCVELSAVLVYFWPIGSRLMWCYLSQALYTSATNTSLQIICYRSAEMLVLLIGSSYIRFHFMRWKVNTCCKYLIFQDYHPVVMCWEAQWSLMFMG